MNLWQQVVDYINSNEEFTRKGFLNLTGDSARHPTVQDGYRQILTRAGYVKRIKRGHFQRIMPIPTDLTKSQATHQAYGA